MSARSLAVVAERNVSIDETFGTLGNGARTTVSPLASFFSVIFGRLRGRAAPGAGGVFCCANAVAVNRIIASSVFILNPFIWTPTFDLVRLGFRNTIDHGAIRCHQVLRRRALTCSAVTFSNGVSNELICWDRRGTVPALKAGGSCQNSIRVGCRSSIDNEPWRLPVLYRSRPSTSGPQSPHPFP